MEWGDQVEFLMNIADETPSARKRLESRPMVPDHLRFVWLAFGALASDRPPGGRIPFTAIATYARLYGLAGGDDFERFRSFITRMDAAVMKKVAEKASKGARG